MNTYLLAAAIVFWSITACVLGAPAFVLWRRRHGREVLVAARSRLVPSAIVLAVGAAMWLNISFFNHIVNMAAIIGALCCYGFLSLFFFQLRPKVVAVPMGLIALVLTLVLAIGSLFDLAFGGNVADSADLGDGLVCHESPYGFAGDGGERLDVFRRYLVIDRRIMSENLVETDAAIRATETPGERATALRCLEAFKRQHPPAKALQALR